MNRYSITACLAALLAVAAAQPPADAQTRWIDPQFQQSDQWGNANNWNTFTLPNPAFHPVASIGFVELGAALSADVQVTGAFTAPTVRVGAAEGSDSSLTIAAGNSLSPTAGAAGGLGDLQIGGSGGKGAVTVGGTLVVAQELFAPTDADFDSTLQLTGSAMVSAAYAFLDRQLQIVGPDVSFTTTGVSPSSGSSLVLGGGGVHTFQFGAAGPSTLNVQGNLDLGGTLKIATPGYTPTPGDSWVIADSVSVDATDASPSGFGFVDDSDVPGLDRGARFVVTSEADGSTANGVATTLTLEQHPVLVINRQSGVASIRNYSASASTIGFDSYDLRSSVGGLSPTELNGLADKGTGPGTWYAAAGTVNGLGELSYPGQTALSPEQSISLGEIFNPPTPSFFGEENEDIQFNYGVADGTIFGGEVVYEGMPNNTLVLNVDPATGDAQILNPSAFGVEIDSYVVSSADGSLNTSLTGWESLQATGYDGGIWYEASEPDEFQVSELSYSGNPTQETAVGANQQDLIPLGELFTIGAKQDLVFQFALVGEEELMTGKVVYSPLVAPVSLPGDYNGDTMVDALDYAVWREANGTMTTLPNDTTPGSVDPGDFTVWLNNFGATAGAAPAPVAPEPTALALLVMAGVATVRRRK